MIRPFTTPLKEILCVVFIAASIYLNYFILIPLFYNKKKHFIYFGLSTVSVLLCACGEILLIKSSILKCFGSVSINSLIYKYLITLYFQIFLRNFGFLCFFILLRVYQLTVYNIERERQSLAETTGIISIIPVYGKVKNLIINRICYFEIHKNVVDIYLNNRIKYQQYTSLADLEKILPKYLYIRVNRYCIVMLNSIVRYTDEGLFVSLDNRFIPYYLSNLQELKEKLYQWNPKLYCPTDDNLATPDIVFPDDDSEEFPKNAEIGVEKFEKCDEFLPLAWKKHRFWKKITNFISSIIISKHILTLNFKSCQRL